MLHAINWFEIPVKDLESAMCFYWGILGTPFTIQEQKGKRIALFSSDEGAIGGALAEGKGYVPGQSGALVYLNGGEDLNVILNKVEGAGGKVLMPKTSIGKWGFIGMFEDSEGNRVGLHSLG
jgi:predicted enzyme related to lactoylglutathione lyase